MATESIGTRVRVLRESHGMSQERLGAILGMSETAVKSLESGKDNNLRANDIKLLCETFREYPGYLLYGNTLDYWNNLFSSSAGDGKEPSGIIDGTSITLMIKKEVENTLGAEGIFLLDSIRQLNEAGQKRAKVLIGDLLKIEEYRIER